MLCANESNDFEPNLARDCAVTLAYLAQVIVPIEVIPSCLDAVEQIVDNSTSWKSKAAVLELLQVSCRIINFRIDYQISHYIEIISTYIHQLYIF